SRGVLCTAKAGAASAAGQRAAFTTSRTRTGRKSSSSAMSCNTTPTKLSAASPPSAPRSRRERMTHTPGEWKWTRLYDDGSGPLCLVNENDDPVILPFLDWSLEAGEGMDDWGVEVDEDDMRLIAAAPDMLA